ncbi:MAG: hypothetical protein LBF78_12535, partial [Treponema sp.]|nr:hypothetical protein [Treponema sp.]
KDTKLGGYSDVKLDSRPLETAMQNLSEIIKQMIADGKSGEAKEYGDILKNFQAQLGAENNEEQKSRMAQEQQTRFFRGLNRFFGAGQNVIGQAGSGNAAAAALSAAGGATDLLGMIKGLPAPVLAAAGIAAAIVGLGAAANKLSEQWEKVMQPSMGLAASLGELGGDAKRNSAVFKEVFNRATDSRILHGYSLEEGLQLATNLSQAGVRSEKVYQAENQVLGYQRATNADRGTLARATGYAHRYRNGENVLGYAYGGLEQSGMQTGQYQEYLNATLRIFEEGLSKGVVKGFAEITRTQNMLAQIGETWKGEAGLERRQNIDSAISGSYNLQSDYDVIMYRAAQDAASPGASHGTTAKMLDQGIDGPKGDQLLRSIGKVIEQTVGKGNTEAGVMTTMRAFKLNYTAAEEFFNAITGRNPDFGKARDILKSPESLDVETTEEKLLTVQQEIRRELSNFGSNFLEEKTGVLSGLQKITNLMSGERSFAASSVQTMDIMTRIGVTGDLARRAAGAFEKAYTKKDQPDADANGLGDYGQNAKTIQDALVSLPPGTQYFLSSNPNNAVYTMLDRFKRAEDFTGENTQQALSIIQMVNGTVGRQSPGDMQKDYLRGVISSIPENANTKLDDRLRYILTHHSDQIPMDRLMSAIENLRTPGSIGGTAISSVDRGGFSEISGLLQAIYALVPELKKLPAALTDASTIVIREEGR